MPRSDPLPREAVRDLLGIVRALYAARKREFASRQTLDELAAIGKALVNALRLAQKSGPDTLAHLAAWIQAEDACTRLVHIISLQTPAAAIVEAAVVRVRRIGRRPANLREERRAAAKIRR